MTEKQDQLVSVYPARENVYSTRWFIADVFKFDARKIGFQ